MCPRAVVPTTWCPGLGPALTIQPGDPRHTFISPRELGMMGCPTLPRSLWCTHPEQCPRDTAAEASCHSAGGWSMSGDWAVLSAGKVQRAGWSGLFSLGWSWKVAGVGWGGTWERRLQGW